VADALERLKIRAAQVVDQHGRVREHAVAGDATSVTQHDVDRLRDLGLGDDEIMDVALAAAVRCFFSKTLDGLGVQADASYADLEPELRETLTVGRPIDDGG
jgi:hypothetical protein